MRTYLKTLGRMFEKHITRFFSIIFIVLVAVGFISGIGSASDKLFYSMTDYYKAQNVSDLIVKSTADEGFSSDVVEELNRIYGSNNVNTGFSVDVYLTVEGEEQLTRLYFLDNFGDDWTVNVSKLTDGIASADKTEVYAESADNKIKGYEAGTEIGLDFKDILSQLAEQNGGELDGQTATVLGMLQPVTVTVTGTLQSPLTFARDGEPSYLNGDIEEMPEDINAVNSLITLENILYISSDVLPRYSDILPMLGDDPVLPTGDIFIAFSDRNKFDAFSAGYKNYVEQQKAVVAEIVGADAEFITLYENYSFVSLNAYSEKVLSIGYVLMVAFLFVTALVVLSNMTRLMEEERGQIACLSTLGYSSFRIVFKYILFAAIATGIGGVGAYFVGLWLAYLLCYVFNYSFAMPPISSHVTLTFFFITFTIIVVATLGATLIAGAHLTKEKPAELLRPKPPKAGKKVFIEKIPIVWNRLSFKYKSTVRNVLRYKSRFFMMVVSVACATALVLAGLALLDLCLFGGVNSPSVMAVAVVVVIFAGLLTAVVVYTLTNINISERNRELATLKVLGYFDGEVSGYIYREIYIDAAVGIIFGYPLSTLIMLLLFSIMGMGSIGGVSWFMWIIAPVVVLLFTASVTLMLRGKIVRIDMNESLKAIE